MRKQGKNQKCSERYYKHTLYLLHILKENLNSLLIFLKYFYKAKDIQFSSKKVIIHFYNHFAKDHDITVYCN